jgi:hypothetical protein
MARRGGDRADTCGMMCPRVELPPVALANWLVDPVRPARGCLLGRAVSECDPERLLDGV